MRVAGLPPVLAQRAHSEGARWTRAVGGRPTTREKVPGDPLLFKMQRVGDGRSWASPAAPPKLNEEYRKGHRTRAMGGSSAHSPAEAMWRK